MLQWQKDSKQRGPEEPPKANAYPGSRCITSSLISSTSSFFGARMARCVCAKMLLRKRMKERTRARMRAGATRTRNPSFGSCSREKELRNPARRVNCSIAERASFPTQSHRRTTKPILAASTTPNVPTGSKKRRVEQHRAHLLHAQHGPETGVSLPTLTEYIF